MTGIVLILGRAINHANLIKEEMSRVMNQPILVTIDNLLSLNETYIRGVCESYGQSIVAYILPPDEATDYNGEERAHWKELTDAHLPSLSVKELQTCPYATDNSKFWLDGMFQFCTADEFVDELESAS